MTHGCSYAAHESRDLSFGTRSSPKPNYDYPTNIWNEETKDKPPYSGQDLGMDPTICPDEGFKWKGRGDPASGKGNWVKGTEKLHQDLRHGSPPGPHWDYENECHPIWGKPTRLFPDGTWEFK